jgi:hypothetical protein
MYASPSNNYGSPITAKPYGGPIARSLTSRSITPSTGNRTRDAMSRAMSDQNRNLMDGGQEQFENKFNDAFQQARADDVMGLRTGALRDYQLNAKKEVDNAVRSMRESQSMRSLASRLNSQAVSDRWGAMMDYTNTFLTRTFLDSEQGALKRTSDVFGEGIASALVPNKAEAPPPITNFARATKLGVLNGLGVQ